MSVWRIVGDHVEPVDGVVLSGVHTADRCEGRPCVIHAPSDHALRPWPLHWRDDRGMFERLCPHGIGHPDPDQVARWRELLEPEDAAAEAVHGCDGCCVPAIAARIAGEPSKADVPLCGSVEAWTAASGGVRGSQGASPAERSGSYSPPEAAGADLSATDPSETPRRADGASGVQDGPAARLRSAADLVEQRAAAATPGPWLPEYALRDRTVQAVFVECDGEDCDHDDYGHGDGTCAIGSFHTSDDNRWSILLGPQIAPHLAAWLRVEATWCSETRTGDDPHLRTIRALALADAILAGEGR